MTTTQTTAKCPCGESTGGPSAKCANPQGGAWGDMSPCYCACHRATDVAVFHPIVNGCGHPARYWYPLSDATADYPASHGCTACDNWEAVE